MSPWYFSNGKYFWEDGTEICETYCLVCVLNSDKTVYQNTTIPSGTKIVIIEPNGNSSKNWKNWGYYLNNDKKTKTTTFNKSDFKSIELKCVEPGGFVEGIRIKPPRLSKEWVQDFVNKFNMIEYVIVYAFTVEPSIEIVPLVSKKKPDFLKGVLNLPGGKLERNEDAINAAIRELKEETGLDEIQQYDPSVFYPSEYMGVIKGSKSIIHCVRVPVSSRQVLSPRQDETEEVNWYDFPKLLNNPLLMPNLRLIIPLMKKGVKGWTVEDLDGDWRDKKSHQVKFWFDEINKLEVKFNSLKFYTEDEEE